MHVNMAIKGVLRMLIGFLNFENLEISLSLFHSLINILSSISILNENLLFDHIIFYKMILRDSMIIHCQLLINHTH